MPPDPWADADDPEEMLGHVRQPPWHYSPRQRRAHGSRLFEYTRRCLDALGGSAAADLFHLLAHGKASYEQIAPALDVLEAQAAAVTGGGFSFGRRTRRPPDAQRARAALAALGALRGPGGCLWRAAVAVTRETAHQLRREQCGWLRCLFPPPFALTPVGTDWLTPTAVDLLNGITAEGAFDRLPILADALQDAGCSCEPLLHHCRHDADHGFGCWAVAALREGLEWTPSEHAEHHQCVHGS